MQDITRRKLGIGIGAVTIGTIGTIATVSEQGAAIDVAAGTMQIDDGEHMGEINEVIAQIDSNIEYESDTATAIQLTLEAGQEGLDTTEIKTKEIEVDNTSGDISASISGDILKSSSLSNESWSFVVGQERRSIDVETILTVTLLDEDTQIVSDSTSDIATITRYKATGELTVTTEGDFVIN